MTARAKRKAPHGGVGVGIFEQVERLIAQKKLNRTAAFQRVAKTSGRRLGTVAANYYRLARQRGVKLRKHRRRAVGGASAVGHRAGGLQRSALRRVLASLREVTAVVRQQEAKISRLRKENERFAKIRRLVAKV